MRVCVGVAVLADGGVCDYRYELFTVMITLSLCSSLFVLLYLSLCLCVSLSFCLSVSLSLCLSLCLSVCLSVCLSLYLSVSVEAAGEHPPADIAQVLAKSGMRGISRSRLAAGKQKTKKSSNNRKTDKGT